jgi:hypothetical protein
VIISDTHNADNFVRIAAQGETVRAVPGNRAWARCIVRRIKQP